MSRWTHVAAVIRFDALRSVTGDTPPNLGNTVNYDDETDKWDACDVPRGSEGSLQYQVWTNPHEHHMAAYTAMIWGDLRDFGNADEVIEYLNRITHGHMIRQGIVEIRVEYHETVIAQHTDDGWVVVTRVADAA